MGNVKPGRFERLVRWYPSQWRARYGRELVALLEDTYGQRRIPLSDRFGIVRTGLAEQRREIGFGGTEETSAGRMRSGSLVVLCGWTVLLVAGASFAKMTEHWAGATPQGDRRLPTLAFDSLQVAAGVGIATVLVAAVIALPSVVTFLREGGWARVRRPVTRALIVSSSTTLLTVTTVLTHPAGQAFRGGGVHAFGIFWALCVVASIGACALATVAVAGHLRLSAQMLRREGLLAVLLSLAILAIVGGALVWSVSIANSAPRLLWGSGSGLFGVPGSFTEILTGLLMLASATLGVRGASRVASSIRAPFPDPST
jgi:hypothetical protein